MNKTKLRKYLGHNGIECRVVIHKDGMIERFGSPDPTDRGKDYWHFVGYENDYKLPRCGNCKYLNWDYRHEDTCELTGEEKLDTEGCKEWRRYNEE